MISVKNLEKAASDNAKAIEQLALKKSELDKTIADLIINFDSTEDSKQQLSILNRLDEIVSAEIFHWSNVLADIPENCSPCMELKGNEAIHHIEQLSPLINEINSLRKTILETI